MFEGLVTAHLIWFLIGVAFLMAELALPGMILIFFALGAWITGLAAWVLGIGLTAQLAVFVAASLASLAALRRWAMRVFKGSVTGQADGLTDEEAALGQTAQVVKAIGGPNLPGEIKYRGSFWRAVAEEPVPEGAVVRIVTTQLDDKSTYVVKKV